MSGSTRRFTPEQQQLAERVCAIGKDAYYEILHLNEQASEDQVRHAFRRLALQLHPDKNSAPRAEDAFKLVAAAWAVLGNAQKRAAYDQDRRRGSRPDRFNSDYVPYDPGFFYGYAPARDTAQNETREQRRERKFEERLRGNASARQEELAGQQAARNVAEMLDSLGVEIHYCANCGTMHLHSRGEAMHQDLGSRKRATQPVNPWAGDNTPATASPESPSARRRKKNRQKNRSATVVVESEQSEPQSVAFTTYVYAMDLSLVARDTILIYCVAEVLLTTYVYAMDLSLVARDTILIYCVAEVLLTVATAIWSSCCRIFSFVLVALLHWYPLRSATV